jgi:transcriptional regulator ATRX
MWVKMEDKHEEVEDIESGLSDSFIDDDDDEDSNNDDDNEPSTSGQDDGTRIQVSLFFFFCFLITVKC